MLAAPQISPEPHRTPQTSPELYRTLQNSPELSRTLQNSTGSAAEPTTTTIRGLIRPGPLRVGAHQPQNKRRKQDLPPVQTGSDRFRPGPAQASRGDLASGTDQPDTLIPQNSSGGPSLRDGKIKEQPSGHAHPGGHVTAGVVCLFVCLETNSRTSQDLESRC